MITLGGAVGFSRRSVRGEVSSHSVRPACLGHRVSTKTLCLLGQPKKAIGSKSPIGPWLATLPSTCLQVSRTEWRRQKTQMEPQGWRTPPLLQSTKRTRTAVLKKTTRTESVHVQAVGLDAGNLPGTEPVERSFLLTSPFIGPRAGQPNFVLRSIVRTTAVEGDPRALDGLPYMYRIWYTPFRG